MIIKTLAELQEPDEASLKFSPWGLGGRMKPEDVARWQQAAVARYEITARVPDTTRLSYERVRTIFSYGVLCYELYTVAGDQARVTIEQALRDRFMAFYNGVVPFIDGQGASQSITAARWQEFFDALNSEGRLRKPKSWKLKPGSGRPNFRFDGMLTSLLRWARAEELLAGQRDRVRDRPRINLRNFSAHGSYHLGMPPDAERAIADLAEIINRIWGAPTGVPVEREVVMIAWDSRTVTWGQAEGFDLGPVSGPETCVIVRAHRLDDLASYDSQYEAVSFPSEYLWGPGPLSEARAWLDDQHPKGDEAQILDRLFALRYHDSRLYLPRSIPVAAGLDRNQSPGIWYLIRADSPVDAFSHQRQLLAGIQGHAATGHCVCPVETIGEGTLGELLTLAAAAGADVSPVEVPDTRVAMSSSPRCNRILGNGSWDIPSDDPFMARFSAGQT